MNRQRLWRRVTAVVVTAVCLLSMPLSAAALPGFSKDCLSIVDEPGTFAAPYVWYYQRDDHRLQASDIVWVDGGHTGKAVSLSGGDEYLELNHAQLQMHTMTFAGWFYWRGAAEGKDVSTQYRQRLFTLSRNDNTWLTLMPHAQDATKTDDNGRSLNGVYLAFSMGNDNTVQTHELYRPVNAERESNGLTQNTWHHIAVTMDAEYLRLYIDGNLWLKEMLVVGVDEMRNNLLTIGGGRWGDPSLNALVDDLSLYSVALNDQQIAKLYHGIDPLAADASLPTTTSPVLPTRPSSATTTAAPEETLPTTVGELDQILRNMPDWALITIGGLLVGFVVFSVILFFYQPPAPPKRPKKRRPKPTVETGKEDPS